MDCSHFETVLEGLEREAPMAANVRAAALQHAESCGDCRGRLAAARLVSLELEALARDDQKLQAPAHVEASLVRAFRENAVRPVRAWRKLSWVGVAAGVALAAWLLMAQPWQQHSESPSQAAPKIQAAQTPSVPQMALAAPGVRAQNRIGARSAHRSSRPAGGRTGTTTSDEFIALSSGGGWYPVGDGMVVRVQLPRSAPALVGLPMSGGDASGTVTADVVLGEDGVARAIRFVPPSEGRSKNQNSDFTQN